MSIYQPYCYLIGWSAHDKWYYGCRYAKGCHPSDLWVSYFTSSKNVKNLRERYGEPDIIQIRKVFKGIRECREWEIKVIRRMSIVSDKKFLNQRNPGGIENFSKKVGSEPWNKNKKGLQSSPYKGTSNRYDDSVIQRISNSVKIFMMNRTQDQIDRKIKQNTENGKMKWLHNSEGIHKRVKEQDLDIYLSQGWERGRIVNRDEKGYFQWK